MAKFILCCGIGLWLCFHFEAKAQNLDTAKLDVMNVADLLENKASSEVKIVSASRSSKNLNDLPITIQVITREEILQNGYITLVDALKHVAGIRVSQPGTGLEGETFLMRGLLGNYYTKILLNSIPLQPSVSGLLPIAEQLPIAQAERIEIIFGPSSSIYGADAMAGVINIITKMPTNNDTFAQGSSILGTSGFRHFNFMTGSKFGKDKNTITYTLYGNYAQKEDQHLSTDERLYSPIYSNVTNALPPPLQQLAQTDPDRFLREFIRGGGFNYYKGTALQAEINERPQNSYLLGFQMNYRNWQFSFNEMYRQNHSSIGLSPIVFSPANPNTFFGDKIQRATLSFNKNLERWSFTANLSYNRYRMDPKSARGANYGGFDGISYKFAASDDIFSEFLARYTSRKEWEWTFGTSFQASSVFPLTNDLIDPFDPDDYKPFTNHIPKAHPILGTFGYNPRFYTNQSIFAQVLKTKKRWTFMAGIRFDANTGYEATQGESVGILPSNQLRIALQYKLKENLSLRFSLGGAFKAPAPNDTYVSLGIPEDDTPNLKGVDYQQIPNPSLRPEILESFELGLRYYPNSNFSLEAVLYAHTISQKHVADFTLVDTSVYPNSISLSNPAIARTYLNDANSAASVASLQVLMKYKNILPKAKLNLDFAASTHFGGETLPDSPLRQNDSLVLNEYRMLPRFIVQLNLDFVPIKNMYVRIENVLMSGWIPRYVVNDIRADYEQKRVKGYYTMDILLRYKLGKNLNTHLRVINVFNANYGGIDATGFDVDLAYNPQYLRTFQVGLNFVLD